MSRSVRAAMVVGAVVGGLALTGCGSTETVSDPGPGVTTRAADVPSPGPAQATPACRAYATVPVPAHVTAADRAQACRRAEDLLRQAQTPSGAVVVGSLPAAALQQPATGRTCDPELLATGRWRVPGTVAALARFEMAHRPTGWGTETSYGSTTTRGEPVAPVRPTVPPMGTPESVSFTAPNGSILAYAFASVPGGVGLRVDAIVVPSGAGCVNPGGPEITARKPLTSGSPPGTHG